MQRFSGSRIRVRRERLNQSREQLAGAIGRSAETIALYERAVVVPPGPVLVCIANALGCEVGDFFEEAERVAG